MSTQPVSPFAAFTPEQIAAIIADPRLHLTLQRGPQTDFATYGHLRDAAGKELAVTLELPGGGNEHDKNCIPAGRYTVRLTDSPRFGRMLYIIENVKDRSGVRIHWGCLPRDTDGCCLLGTGFGQVNYNDGKPNGSGPGIVQSVPAFNRFMEHMAGVTTFTLDVLDPPVEHQAAA